MASFCLEVSGPFACFTRPEMKVERVSYDVMTPSSARSIFEAILWKPAIRWRVHRIEVLKPIRWINLRRNEVSAVVSTRNVQQAMAAGSGREEAAAELRGRLREARSKRCCAAAARSIVWRSGASGSFTLHVTVHTLCVPCSYPGRRQCPGASG